MSRTLNLVAHLLDLGCKYQNLGRDREARQVLGRLADFRELPAPVAGEARARLAELAIKRRKYRRARRHLAAALAHRPDQARYHYLLANALDSDTRGNAGRAAEHYRKSLELDPNQPACLGEFGLLALRLGQTEEGLQALRRAVELAPDDPAAVGNLVEGLRLEGLVDEARAVLRAALFRNSRDGRFRKLKNDFEYHQLRQQQMAERLTSRAAGRDDGPVLLPFVRPVPGGRTAEVLPKILRRDGAAPPTAPHLPDRNRRPDQKRAQ